MHERDITLLLFLSIRNLRYNMTFNITQFFDLCKYLYNTAEWTICPNSQQQALK